MKAMMKQVVATNKVGIHNTPNQPTYKRLSVEVTHWQNCCQGFVCLCKAIVAVVIFKKGSKYEFKGRTESKYFHGTLSLGYERRFTSDGLGCRSVRNRKVLSWFPNLFSIIQS